MFREEAYVQVLHEILSRSVTLCCIDRCCTQTTIGKLEVMCEGTNLGSIKRVSDPAFECSY